MDYKSPLRIAMEKAMNGEHAFTRENPEPLRNKTLFYFLMVLGGSMFCDE